MTGRDIAKAAAAAAGVALAALAAGQLMPSAPGQQLCVVAWAQGPCEAALALGSTDPCKPGSLVTLPVEIPLPDEDADGGAALPPGFDGLPGQTKEVPCASLDHPGKALHVAAAAKYGVIHFDGGIPCAPAPMWGHEPPGCAGPVAPEVGP